MGMFAEENLKGTVNPKIKIQIHVLPNLYDFKKEKL